MDIDGVNEIIACLPHERTLFHYHRDRYALMLLGWAAGTGRRVDELRRGPFAPLLDKPLVRQALAGCGSGRIDRSTLEAVWPDSCSTFLLTLGCWGSGDRGWDQTSRKGHNLVLRLNFNHGHDRAYRALIRPGSSRPFDYAGHPVLVRGERACMRETLAWARLDIDLDRSEALVEEIQSDWVRCVAELMPDGRAADDSRIERWGCNTSAAEFRRYADGVFAPYRTLWDQAMLSAAIRFIRDELGLRHIWYHSWSGGNRLKRLSYSQPPRSLYTRLPRRFCFQSTREAPGFIRETREYRRTLRRQGPIDWYRLAV